MARSKFSDKALQQEQLKIFLDLIFFWNKMASATAAAVKNTLN
jgi:hypothetical protein